MYWILTAITLAGMILRLIRINSPIDYDEAYTFIYYATKPFKQILSDYSAPNNHILHTILVSIVYQILGGHFWIVRLPALLAGTLCIPAAYFTARRMFNAEQALAGAALVALTPWLISYSVNGRGYTLLALLSLLLANFGAVLIRKQSRAALVAYGITGALGFYTVPIFLYPMAGVSLWVLIAYLTEKEPWEFRFRNVTNFLVLCALAGLLTFLLYSPVIFFGTGARSIFANEFVESGDWTFVENLPRRAERTWETWMIEIAPWIQYLLLAGFLVSTFFYKKIATLRLPLQLFLLLAIAILLPIQRVAPFARVWLYLEFFYLIFAGAGLAWLIFLAAKPISGIVAPNKLISGLVLIVVITVFVNGYRYYRQPSVQADQTDVPELYAAEYLAEHLSSQDTILSIAPVDMRVAYYLFMDGIPYDVFYQRTRPVKIENALIVLRTNTQYNSPERVLEFYNLTSNLNLQSAELVFQYGALNIFSVPANDSQ